MKSWTLVVAGILFSFAAAPATGQAQSAAPKDATPGSIRGRITAVDTGRPLRRARVTVRSTSETGNANLVTANTNSLGQFEAKNVAKGTYYVAVSRAPYLNMQYGQRRPGERGLTVEVGSGQAVNGIDIALPRGGVFAGLISDDLGEPYPGVRVTALAMRYQRGQRVPFPSGGATTDDLGNFRIPGLMPGSYYLTASSTETWRTGKQETYGYASTFFPGGSLERAQVIPLRPSEQRTDLNFSLQVSRAARITGRVQRESGEPIGGAGVSLAYSYPGVIMTAGMRTVRAAADGSFEIRDVPAGVYSVGGGSAEQIVTVDGADIENLLLVPKTGSSISGTLVTDAGTPPPFPSSGVRVTLSAASDKVLPTVYINPVNPDWSFKLSNLGGPFMFRVAGLPADWTLGAVRLNEKDITDTPWDVPTGAKELVGLKIVVTQKIGTLSGLVVDASGKPSTSATIVVFSDDADHWIPGSRFIRTTRPGADGRFSLRDLPAGTYRAIARDYVEDGQWEDRKFLDEARNAAASFTLGEGGTETITLRLPAVR